MVKRLFCLIITALLSLSLFVPVSALDGKIVPRLADGAEILSESEEEKLLDKLDSISKKHGFDVVIITVETLKGSGMTSIEFADDTYDYNDFGFGNAKNGILLLVNIEDGKWAISTSGYGKTAFTDDGWRYIGEQIEPLLSDGEFYAALDLFADLCDDFLIQAETGDPYTAKNLPRGELSILWIPGSILIGMGISLVIMLTFRGQLKSVRRKPSARDYQVPDSLRITSQSETFLYRHVSRVPRQTQSNSKNGGVRVGSSGRSHGGGSGRF